MNLKILLAAAALACPAGGRAEPPAVTMDWQKCLEEAVRQNPSLASARAQVAQAVEQVAETRSALLPELSGRASWSHSKSSGESGSDRYSYSISGDQLIFDGLDSWYRTGRQQQNLLSSRYSYRLTSASVRQSLREAYIDLIESQELLTMSEEIARRRKQQLDMVQLRYEAGNEHRGSLMTSQANLADARFDVDKARRDILLAQRNLSREIGRATFTPITVEGSLVSPPVPAQIPPIEEIARVHPSTRQQEALLEAAEYDLKSARAGFFPSIRASASLGRSGDEWPPDSESWSTGVSLSLPIFTGGSRLAEVNKSEAALTEQKEDARETWNDTIYYLEHAWKSLLDEDARVGIQKQYLEADEERAKIAEAQYATGLLSFDNWIIIEDNLVSTRKSDLSSRADALRAWAEWEYRTGLTMESELSGEN